MMKKSNILSQTTQNSKLKTQNSVIPTEDFWSRQANAQTELFELAPFGIPTKITANQADVLAAAYLSSLRFSQAVEKTTEQQVKLQIVVQSKSTDPIPDNLPAQLTYSGVGKWITLSAGEWGQGFANLETCEGVIVLSPALAAETRLVSRCFIDHYLLNFILARWAMLHASCVLSPDKRRLIVMIAPHNTGKSTTSLHLLRAGYIFLADGMALLGEREGEFIAGGYPIGEVKLRDDVLAMFPEYTGPSVRVREHQKTVVNLRDIHPERIVETLVIPESIQLCFVERTNTSRTQVSELSPSEAVQLLLNNTVYWDEPSQLANNNKTLANLIRVADLYQLSIGSDIAEIVAVIDKLA